MKEKKHSNSTEHRKAGDEVSVTTEEGGSYTVRIKSITKEEDNGDGPIL